MPGPAPLRRRDMLLLAAATPIALSLPLPALAQSADEFARRKINLAGRQRMLTQRMSRGALFASVDVEAERHMQIMVASANLFDRTLKGLRDGDEELGLPLEENAIVLAKIRAVEDIWAIFKPVLDKVEADGQVSDANIRNVAQLNLQALTLSDDVVKSLVSEYGDRDTDLGLAVSINVAGRQRMLSQKMAKEAALLALGFDAAETATALGKTAGLFEASLAALINGLPTITLPAPPENVRAKLLEVEAIWQSYGKVIRTVAEAGFASGFDLAAIANQADPLLTTMNEAVTLYEEI